jgi:hypothetical protein
MNKRHTSIPTAGILRTLRSDLAITNKPTNRMIVWNRPPSAIVAFDPGMAITWSISGAIIGMNRTYARTPSFGLRSRERINVTLIANAITTVQSDTNLLDPTMLSAP